MNDLVILVPSCDAYTDTWRPFFFFFWKYWPTCPFKVYLGTNYKDFDDKRVTVIKVGEDLSWAESIREMLTEIDSKYVLICLEDYFFYKIEADKILETFEAVRSLNARYLKLTPDPIPDIKLPDYPLIGEIKKGARYRTSVGFGFWEVKTLLNLLQDGESAWEMETNGSDRAKDLDGFYRTWRPLVGFHNAIVCGTWRRHALEYCKETGVEVDTSKRPIYTLSESAWIAVKSFIRRTISYFPEPLFTLVFELGRNLLIIFRRIFNRSSN